jgi:hypothetical protein
VGRRSYQWLTPEAVDQIWVRLRAGQAAKPAARELGLCTGTVRAYFVRCGGIRPGPRHRASCRLTMAEREEISRGLAAGHSILAIAAGLGRAPSTISREVNANGGVRRYRAARADQAAWARAARPKACKLAGNPALRDIVEEKLARRWSPEQIAGWLKLTYPERPEMQVSHESIYRTLFVQSRGALRRELTRYLRTGRVIRRPKGVRLPDGRGGRPDTLHISERPPEAQDRAVPGALGGRPGLRQAHEPGGHLGRAPGPVPDAGRSARGQPPGRRGRRRAGRGDHHLAQPAGEVADLGPRP